MIQKQLILCTHLDVFLSVRVDTKNVKWKEKKYKRAIQSHEILLYSTKLSRECDK